MESIVSEKSENIVDMGNYAANRDDDSQDGDVVVCCKSKNGPIDGRKKKPRFTNKQKLSLVTLALADFMSYCSLSILAPFYPAVSAEKGMSETMSGMIFGYYALVIFLSSPALGKLLPKFGIKLIFLTGLFLSGTANIIFGLLGDIEDYTLFVTLSFLVRGFVALGASAHLSAAYVLVINIFPDHAGAVRGILETFVGLGLCVGPSVGGFLYTVGGFGLPFYVIGVITILTASINSYILDRPEKNSVEKSGSLTKLLLLPPVMVTCLVMIVNSMTNSCLDPTFEPHLRKFNLGPSQVGFVFLLLSGSYGFSSPLFGWITDKFNDYTWLMTTGVFGTSVAMLFLGPSPILIFLGDSLALNLIVLPFLGVFIAMGLMPTYQFILDCSLESGSKECLGTHCVVAGLWSSVYSLGEVVGPSAAGAIMEHFGFPIMCTTFALLNFAVGVVALIYFKIRSISLKKVAKEKSGFDNVVFCIEGVTVDKVTTSSNSIIDDSTVSTKL